MEFSVINDALALSPSNSRIVNIILAENGSLYENPYIKFVSPIGVKRAPFLTDFIDKEYGIAKANQLILRSEDGKQLDPSASLEEFFQKDRTIFVYTTKGQSKEVAQDDFEIIGGLSLEKKWSESCMQFLPSIYENHFGSNVRDSLEPHVTNFYDDLMALFCDVKTELNSLREGVTKLKRQKSAEGVAKKNLVNYYIEKKRQFDETLSQKEAKIIEFQQYIDNFDAYIEKMSKQEIEPQLAEEDKTYLVDYFDVEKLQRSKTVYDKNQAKIQQKAQEIKDEILQYDNQLKNIEGAVSDDYSDVQNLLNTQEHSFADVQDRNLQEFKRMIEDKNENPTQKDLSDFIKRECEVSIPKLKEIFQALRQCRQKLEERLKENASKLKDLISDITNLRVIIKGKIYNKLKVFCSLVEKHEEGIFNLEIIEKFPQVYQQSLNEIKRRGTFKKDYLTVLNILESFGNSENRFRQEFLEMYQQFLPKSFCPFLSKSFPTLRFENIKRMVDQDLNISLTETVQSFGRPSSEADILKLLKNLNDNLESKDIKNKGLEDNLQLLREENEKLREQLKQRALNVPNLRKLFGATGFQEKIDDFLNAYKFRFIDKIDQIEKRVKDLQAHKFEPLQMSIGAFVQEVPKSKTQMLVKLEGLERLREENEFKIASLQSCVEQKEILSKEFADKNEKLESRLEEILKENNILLEEKNLRETEALKLSQQIKKHEKREKDFMQSKDQQSVLLRSDLESTKEELRTCQETSKHDQEKILELTTLIQNLEGEILHLEQCLQKSEMDAGKYPEIQKSLAKQQLIIKDKEKQCAALKSDLKKREVETEQLLQQIQDLVTTNSEPKEKKNVDNHKADDNNKDNEIRKLKELVVGLEAKSEELQSCVDGSAAILSDMGADIINFYTKILGKHAADEMKFKEFDLREVLDKIAKFVLDSMVKIQDFGVGDRVIAMKCAKNRYALLSRNLADLKIVYTFETQEDLTDVVMVEIKDFGEYSNKIVLVEKVDAIIPVVYTNAEPLSYLNRHR